MRDRPHRPSTAGDFARAPHTAHTHARMSAHTARTHVLLSFAPTRAHASKRPRACPRRRPLPPPFPPSRWRSSRVPTSPRCAACAPPPSKPSEGRSRRTWSSSAPPRPRATSTWRTRMILTTSPRSTRRILRWRQVRLAAAVGRAGAAPSCGQTRASLASRGHQGSTGAGGDDGKNLYTKEIVVREIAGG